MKIAAFFITVNAKHATPEMIRMIRGTFGLFPGDTPVFFRFHAPDAPPVLMECAADCWVSPCAELAARLATLTNGLN